MRGDEAYLKSIWKITQGIADVCGFRRTRLFMAVMSAIFFGVGCAVSGLSGCIAGANVEEIWGLALCAGGYAGIFPGYFGAMVYLMRHEKYRDRRKKKSGSRISGMQ